MVHPRSAAQQLGGAGLRRDLSRRAYGDMQPPAGLGSEIFHAFHEPPTVRRVTEDGLAPLPAGKPEVAARSAAENRVGTSATGVRRPCLCVALRCKANDYYDAGAPMTQHRPNVECRDSTPCPTRSQRPTVFHCVHSAFLARTASSAKEQLALRQGPLPHARPQWSDCTYYRGQASCRATLLSA